MSTFSSLVLGPTTFIPTAEGYYSASTRGFSDPVNQVKINGGRKNPKTGKTTSSVTRFWEVETVPGNVASRSLAEVTVIIQAGAGITSTNLDTLIADLSTLLTPAMVDQIMQGGK
jgi:hypothetical protein